MPVDNRILEFDSEESEPDGFYQIIKSNVNKNTRVIRGPLDKYITFKKIDITYMTATDEPLPEPLLGNANETIFGHKKPINRKDYETADLELDFNPFLGQKPAPQKQYYADILEMSDVAEPDRPKAQQKYQKNLDHSKLRPYVVQNGLEGLIVCKIGSLAGFTDQEYREYVERQNGRAILSFSKRAHVLVVPEQSAGSPHIQQARKLFIRVQNEDEFYHFVVQSQIRALCKAYELQKKAYPAIRSSEDIKNIMGKLNWVDFDNCSRLIGLRDIDSMCRIEFGAVEHPYPQTAQPPEPAVDAVPLEEPHEQEESVFVRPLGPTRAPAEACLPFCKKHAPDSYFLIQTPCTDQIRTCVRNNEPVLVAGPTGCGKTTTVLTILKDLNLQVYQAETTDQLQLLLCTGQLAARQQKAVFIDDLELFGDYSALVKAIAQRGGNRVVATCNSAYNQRLRIVRQKFKEIRLAPQTVKYILFEICYKERKTLTRDAQLPIYEINTLIDEIAAGCQQDVRQAINQLEFRLARISNNKIRIYKPITLFELAGNIFRGNNVWDNYYTYYVDPNLTHYFLAQNYYYYGNYATRYLSYIAELLSQADAQIARMFRLGDWSGYNIACVNETFYISMARRLTVQGAQIQFPSALLNLREGAGSFYYNDAYLLVPADNAELLDLGLRILDASFYLGFDAADEEEQKMDMGLGEHIKDLLHDRQLHYCQGSARKRLIDWVVGKQELVRDSASVRREKK